MRSESSFLPVVFLAVVSLSAVFLSVVFLAGAFLAPAALTLILPAAGDPAAFSGLGVPAAHAADPQAADPEPTDAASGDLLESFLADPMLFFFEQRTTEALQCGQVILAEPELAGEAREPALTALGAVYLASDRPAQARAAFLELLRIKPAYELPRPERLPPPVVTLFYSLRDSALLANDDEPVLDIRTLAVGDIENNSIVSGRYDLDRFARGLTQIIVSDLSGATPLKIVDRQRLAVIRREIALSSNDQVTDPAFRVPFGKLTGAQSFLFGSIIQAEKDKVRLDLRWVDTSTGEILLAEGVEAKLKSSDDLFKLERKVLLDLLLPRIHALLGDDQAFDDLEDTMKPFIEERRKRVRGGDAYAALLLKTGEAILAEESGDLAAARAAWAEVALLDPQDPTARDRTLALNAYLSEPEAR